MTALPEKRCFKCGETKPLSDFYKHPQMADGHVNKCKECNKKDVIANRESRSDYYNAYDRQRSKLEHRREYNTQRNKIEEVRLRNNETKRLSSDRLWKRKKAAEKVNNALRDGRLCKLPCAICGGVEVQGHHPDYDSPLDVVWLCVKHHSEIHRKYDHEQDIDLLETAVKGNRWDSEVTV